MRNGARSYKIPCNIFEFGDGAGMEDKQIERYLSILSLRELNYTGRVCIALFFV